jgi:uncharacterized LabA/DUF88 family protein
MGFLDLPAGYVLADKAAPKAAAFFLWIAEMTKRVAVYIDGFNLYHAIDDSCSSHHKWVDLFALSQSLLREGEVLSAVNYFSAYATWLPAQYKRHRTYVVALQHAGVTTVMGKFKKKDMSCKVCKSTWTGHEEKESDVRLSIGLVADAFQDKFDRAIVVSADSDLVPPIDFVRATFKNKEVFVAAPPGRMGVGRDLNPKLEITRGRISKNLLPVSATDAQGNILFNRPHEYAPPQPTHIQTAAANVK